MAPSSTEKSTIVLDNNNYPHYSSVNRVQGESSSNRHHHPSSSSSWQLPSLPYDNSFSPPVNKLYGSSSSAASSEAQFGNQRSSNSNSNTNIGSLEEGRFGPYGNNRPRLSNGYAQQQYNPDSDYIPYGDEVPVSTPIVNVPSTNSTEPEYPPVVIRGEEIGIVVMVLLLWVGAIILFFNRWGKIRMLEPYQPKFCENHRLSCPMADAGLPHGPRTYSKYNLSNELAASPHFAKCNYHGIGSGIGLGLGSGIGGLGLGTSGVATSILSSVSASAAGNHRPRQNSVFVTSPHSTVAVYNSNLIKNTSRKTKSAIDLSTLILTEEFMENVRRNSKNSITHL